MVVVSCLIVCLFLGVYYCKSGDMTFCLLAISELMDVKYVSQSECRYTEYWSTVEIFFEKINTIFPELTSIYLISVLFSFQFMKLLMEFLSSNGNYAFYRKALNDAANGFHIPIL